MTATSRDLCQVCLVRPTPKLTTARDHRRRSMPGHDMCAQCWRENGARRKVRPSRGRMDGVLDDLMDAAALAATEGR